MSSVDVFDAGGQDVTGRRGVLPDDLVDKDISEDMKVGSSSIGPVWGYGLALIISLINLTHSKRWPNKIDCSCLVEAPEELEVS